MIAHIIVVGDEPQLQKSCVSTLSAAGYRVSGAGNAAACRQLMRTQAADLIVVDLGPSDCGPQLASALGASNAGLMAVSSHRAPEDRIAALDAGYDDYIVKPVHLGELAARVRAILRRRASRSAVHFAGFTLDLTARTFNAGSRPIDLTRGEFTLMTLLAAARGAVVDREALCAPVSRNGNATDLRTVDALIRRIRRKLEKVSDAPIIATVPGLGYRLAAEIE